MKLNFCVLAFVIVASVLAHEVQYNKPIPIALRKISPAMLSGQWFQIAKTGSKNACQCSQVSFEKKSETTFAMKSFCLSGEEKGVKSATFKLNPEKREVELLDGSKNTKLDYTIMKDQLIILENRETDEAIVMSRHSCSGDIFKKKEQMTKRILAANPKANIGVKNGVTTVDVSTGPLPGSLKKDAVVQNGNVKQEVNVRAENDRKSAEVEIKVKGGEEALKGKEVASAKPKPDHVKWRERGCPRYVTEESSSSTSSGTSSGSSSGTSSGTSSADRKSVV